MKQVLLSTLAAMSQQSTVAQAGAPKEMKIAFDITDSNPKALIAKLTVIDLTRKQLIESGVTPKIVLAFRGEASFYTQTNLEMVKEADRTDALTIAAMLRELRKANGIEALEQCAAPLAARKLKPADVMQEVKLVPNSWITLAIYQQKGYAYIAP